MQHTPGPWRATSHGQTISIDNPDFLGIAFINPGGNHNSGIPSLVNKANAALFIAAPKMLEALRKISALRQEYEDPIDAANVAMTIADAALVGTEGL
jgi:hypothetical protein